MSDMKSSIKIITALASALLLLSIMVSGGCDEDTAWDTVNSSKREIKLLQILSTPHTIGVTVSGLDTGGTTTGVTLRNNGGDDLTITVDGTAQFSTPLYWGDIYNVSVYTQPMLPDQACNVTGGTGIVRESNVTTITVTCL